MKVLELFCGTKSFTKVAEARGHECRTLDNDPRFEPTYCMDIRRFSVETLGSWRPDVVWASPPCQCFSVASIGTHWTGGHRKYLPRTSQALDAILVVNHTLKVIGDLTPRVWFIENPRGLLRKMTFMPGQHLHTAWYCQYGDSRAKPTDIWTNLRGYEFRTCRNGAKDHEEARRGAKNGTQGRRGSIERGIVPEMFCRELLIACENRGIE